MLTPNELPPPGPSRFPKILTRIGGIAIVVAVVTGILGVMLLITGVVKSDGDEARNRQTLTVEVPMPGTTDVQLEADTYEIVGIGTGLVRTEQRPVGRSETNRDQPRPTRAVPVRNEFAEPTVTITRNGNPVTIGKSKDQTLTSEATYDLVSLGSFEATIDGTYRIQTTGEPSGVTAVGIDDTIDGDGFGVIATIGAGLFVIAFLAFPLGVVMVIIGLVWGTIDRISSGQPPSGPRTFGGISFGSRTITTSTYPASFRPPGTPTSSTTRPPPPPPPPPPAPPERPPPPPWEPPQGPIS